MKKILYLSLLIVLMSSCMEIPSYGYLVHKEYVKYHMSNEKPKIIHEAALFGYVHVPVVRRHRSKPKLIPSEWKFYVGNKYGVRQFNVDSLTYIRFKCGDKIRF